MWQELSSNEDKIRKIEHMYRRKENMMYHIAFMILKNKQDAEDAVHDAFISVIEKVNIIPCKAGEIDAYLTKCVKNRALTMLKQRQKKENYELRDYEATVSDVAVDRLIREEIHQYFAQLDKRSREIIYMRYVYDKSYEEIAQEMNVTQENARQILSRAIRKLSKLYGNNE